MHWREIGAVFPQARANAIWKSRRRLAHALAVGGVLSICLRKRRRAPHCPSRGSFSARACRGGRASRRPYRRARLELFCAVLPLGHSPPWRQRSTNKPKGVFLRRGCVFLSPPLGGVFFYTHATTPRHGVRGRSPYADTPARRNALVDPFSTRRRDYGARGGGGAAWTGEISARGSSGRRAVWAKKFFSQSQKAVRDFLGQFVYALFKHLPRCSVLHSDAFLFSNFRENKNAFHP